MLKAKLPKLVCLLLLVLVISSCANKKKFIYFQGAFPGSESNKNYEPVLRADDLLSIIVSGLDADAVRPFNLPTNVYNSNVGGYNIGAQPPSGYLIYPDGNVDFPVIGRVKLGGLTRSAAIDSLKQKLKPYLSNPNIQMRILNFKVTVLGEVRNPGTFTIPNERVTLPEALGIAGDLNITGVRKNVLVVRDIDGKKTETRIDLTSADLFSSPVYYLNQNDLIYVEPNKARVNSSIINPANAGILISSISLIVTLIAILSGK